MGVTATKRLVLKARQSRVEPAEFPSASLPRAPVVEFKGGQWVPGRVLLE